MAEIHYFETDFAFVTMTTTFDYIKVIVQNYLSERVLIACQGHTLIFYFWKIIGVCVCVGGGGQNDPQSNNQFGK